MHLVPRFRRGVERRCWPCIRTQRPMRMPLPDKLARSPWLPSNGSLLGRRAELAAVDAALERARAPPRRGARVLAARAGSARRGCSTSSRARAARRGALVLGGRASELERELPFGVWEDALAEHAEFLGVDRLERLVGDQLPELAAVLPAVGRVPAGLQDERYRTHRAVRALLEALAQRQPVVLVARRPALGRRRVAGARRRTCCGARRAAASLLALAFRPAPVRPLLATALATAERDGAVIEHPLGALSFADAETLLGADDPRPGARRDLRGRRRQPVLPAAARARARGGPQRSPPSPPGRACRARWRARWSRRSRR